ncbi:MAG: hypothetical protein HQ596_08180, partial [Candidatus Saganbacteria bacterium]|nr:hypothetical protein [Candidatus Saganbacteria bacterium]
MNISFAFISFLIMAFVSVILGSIVFLKDTKRKRNIYFFLLTICIAVWILANFLENEKIGLFWSSLALRIDFIAAPLVSLFFILFCLNFPEEGKIPKSVIAGLYLLTSFFCIAATTNLIVGNFVFVHEKLIYSTGNLYLPYALFHIFLMSFGALVILMNLFKYKGAQRTQSAYVFFGFSFSAATILALNLILEQIVFIPREIARFGIYSLLVFETLTAYAITKHELMDIRVVITRAMAYGVVVFSLVASFVGFNLLKLPLAVGILGNVLLGLFWAYAAHRLREFVQTPLEEKWITGWYDSDRLINTIARKLVPVMERQEAFEITADELKSAIKIKKVDILTGSE